MNNKKIIFAFIITTVLISTISFLDIIKNTIFLRKLLDKKSLIFLIEFIIVYIILCSINIFKGHIKIYLYAFVIYIYLYIHQISFAIFFVFLYILGFILSGELLLLVYRKKTSIIYTDNISRYIHSFIIGVINYTFCICLLSLFKIGNIKEIYIFSFGYLVIAYILYIYCYIKKLIPLYFIEEKKENKQFNKIKVFLICNIIAILLLQASRLNISIDYDSIRYALRSNYILNIGNGIYENLGLLNVVYTYPKGFELLTYPLNILNSYSFIQAFSFLCLIMVLFTIYEIISLETYDYIATFAIFIVIFIPAITNMGISAKTDIITLLFQLFAILDILKYIKYKNEEYLSWTLAALMLSSIYKPTSLIYSSLIFLSLIIYIFLKGRIIFKLKNIFLLVYTFLVVFLVHLRSFFITGHFFTSIFTGIFEKIGFHIKYPYKIENIPKNAEGLDIIKQLYIFLKRIYYIFISPREDIHIFIAFGTSLIFILILFNFVNIFKKNKSEALKFLYILFLVIFISSLYTLQRLYQIDGNYYILLYSLSIIVFILSYKDILEFNIKYSLLVFLFPCIISLLLTITTNWAGVLGNTEISFENSGFYEHIKDNKNHFFNNQEGEIYSYLNSQKKSRLLSIAYEPYAYMLPAISQTYTDITGSGGNVLVVKYLDNFKKFLNYAEIDYIYTENAYLKDHKRADEIIQFMLEDKSLRLIIDAGKTSLYKYIKN